MSENSAIEWVEFDPVDLPPVPKCPVGVFKHRWLLRIEEGRPDFSLADGEECVPHLFPGHDTAHPVCVEELYDLLCNDGGESVKMSDPIPVTLSMHVERTYDDVYGWIEVSPAGSGGVR